MEPSIISNSAAYDTYGLQGGELKSTHSTRRKGERPHLPNAFFRIQTIVKYVHQSCQVEIPLDWSLEGARCQVKDENLMLDTRRIVSGK